MESPRTTSASGFWRFCCPGERAVQTSVIKDPGRLAHMRLTRACGLGPGSGSTPPAGSRPIPVRQASIQPVWAGPGDDDLKHGASSLVVDIGITRNNRDRRDPGMSAATTPQLTRSPPRRPRPPDISRNRTLRGALRLRRWGERLLSSVQSLSLV